MRRLNLAGTAVARDERGVIAPLTAILMTALLGMTAFAVDTAMMYSEKAQLQNSADAAALAIAHACADDPASVTCQQQKAAASALADGNTLDGVAGFFTPKLDLTNGTVDVEVETADSAGKKGFPLVFARFMGIDSVDISASAQAKFDGYSKAPVLPITFSKCETDPDFSKGLQFLPLHGSALAQDPARMCKTKSSSGAEVSGGFGWLSDNVQDGACTLTVSLATRTYQSDPGVNVPTDCNQKFSEFEKDLAAGKTVDVLVPVFDYVSGKGKDAVFYIEAFAQISLRGWHFGVNGRHYLTPDAQVKYDSMGLKGTDAGLFGKYVKKISWADAAALGGPRIYGAGGVRLSN